MSKTSKYEKRTRIVEPIDIQEEKIPAELVDHVNKIRNSDTVQDAINNYNDIPSIFAQIDILDYLPNDLASTIVLYTTFEVDDDQQMTINPEILNYKLNQPPIDDSEYLPFSQFIPSPIQRDTNPSRSFFPGSPIRRKSSPQYSSPSSSAPYSVQPRRSSPIRRKSSPRYSSPSSSAPYSTRRRMSKS
jgi:hypothetical protein